MTEEQPAKSTHPNALDLLFDDPKHAGAAIEKAIHDKKLLETMPDHEKLLRGAAGRFLVGAVVEAIESVLGQIGVDGMLLGGWTKLEEVERARVITRADHSARYVTLLEHDITSEHAPRINLMVNEVATPLLHLRLDAKLKLKGVELLVEDGEIKGVAPGAASAATTLFSGPVMVLTHELAKLDPARLAEQLVEKLSAKLRRVVVDRTAEQPSPE